MNKIIICALSALLTFSAVGCTDNTINEKNQEVQSNQENNQSPDSQDTSENSEDNESNQVGENSKNNIESKSITGYIVFEDNKVIINEVEIINRDNVDRIEELGLDVELSFPDGYYIYNPDDEVTELELSDDIVYKFTDIGQIYEKEAEDRVYETNKIEEFYEASSYNQDFLIENQRIPYFIDIVDGKVEKITEEFRYTM